MYPSPSSHPPLALSAVPWRFLRQGADTSSPPGSILTPEGLRYIEEDAARWQQGGPITCDDVIGRRPPHAAALASSPPQLVDSFAHDSDDEDDDAPSEQPPLAEFNPFSSDFSLTLHNAPSAPTVPSPTSSSAAAPPDPFPSSLSATSDLAAATADEDEQRRQRSKGLAAAELLSHYANKGVLDEERERTRKRERSKWEHADTKPSSEARGDGGGVMVGGLGLDSADATPPPLPPPSADDPDDELRRSAALASAADSGQSDAAASEMPDISDFIRLYEDEDEPSYPAMLWRVKERLTAALDVPEQVRDELSSIERQRRAMAASRGRAAGGGRRPSLATRLPRVRGGGEGKARLRFNLGEGKDYIEEAAVLSHPSSGGQPFLPPIRRSPMSLSYGRQWYLPPRQWRVPEEAKERMMEATRAEASSELPLDAYHGEEWRERLQSLTSSLPPLYCSQAFKAFLRRGGSGGMGVGVGGQVREPHWLGGVEALDERKEEDEERKAMQAAMNGGGGGTVGREGGGGGGAGVGKGAGGAGGAEGGRGEGSEEWLQQPAGLVAGMGKRGKDEGLVGEDEDAGRRGEGEDEEGEGDLKGYMREVRLRELSLAGVKLVKEREREMQERERRKREREKLRLRAGAAVLATSAEEVEAAAMEAEEVDLDRLFDIASYPCTLGGD